MREPFRNFYRNRAEDAPYLATEPSIGDGWPAVSPDGLTVAFARYSQDTSADIHIVPIGGGEPRQVTADKASILGLAWTPDGELVFSSDRDGAFRLWRVAAKPVPDAPVAALDIAGEDARFPSISSSSDDHPRYSPDGTKIAFVSRRSGTKEIWVCASDASNPVRLTAMGGPIIIGPQWSPDGRRIAFFATTSPAGRYADYVTGAEDGRTSRLTRTEGELETLPAWSRAG